MFAGKQSWSVDPATNGEVLSPIANFHDGEPQSLPNLQERHKPTPVLSYQYVQRNHSVEHGCKTVCSRHYQHDRPDHRRRYRQHVPAHCTEPQAHTQCNHGSVRSRHQSTIHCVCCFSADCNRRPDAEIERSNATHKHFIDALSEALNALGDSSRDPNNTTPVGEELDDELIFRNQFSALSLGTVKLVEDEESSGDDVHSTQVRSKNKKAGKGKKGKRGRKSKPKPNAQSSAKSSMADIPVESYRIIEDTDGLVSEYLVAVYSVISEWVELRSFTQELWRETAYANLNGAVSASLTKSAVAMIKQTCIAVFAEFPGHESYKTIIQTITHGDRERAQAQFGLSLYRVSECGHQTEKVQERTLDAKEQFWVHAYNDLVAFITDFQKNRTGKR